MSEKWQYDNISIGKQAPLLLISGPCVIEDYDVTYKIATVLKRITEEQGITFVFKASYDKANRTSHASYRGPGIREGLAILKRIKSELNLKILSDVHRISEVDQAAEVLDIIQIPAFLCRQTDMISEVARTGKIVNIKKGQFLAPWDMQNVIDKIASTGNHRILITERGTMFGYNNLVVDFRGIKIMQDMGVPVVFDATHSVQLPGGGGGCSDGQREFAPLLANAAVATGAEGIFLEVHQQPDKALCDGPNSIRLDDVSSILAKFKTIRDAVDL